MLQRSSTVLLLDIIRGTAACDHGSTVRCIASHQGLQECQGQGRHHLRLNLAPMRGSPPRLQIFNGSQPATSKLRRMTPCESDSKASSSSLYHCSSRQAAFSSVHRCHARARDVLHHRHHRHRILLLRQASTLNYEHVCWPRRVREAQASESLGLGWGALCVLPHASDCMCVKATRKNA